jgi:hypothetical protein
MPVPNSARHRFEHPDAWHAPAAYWFWHHLPDETQIRAQVREMFDAGILSFQVQARSAYPLEGYLDENYLAACRIAVDEAKELGMMVGVYDDYNWQSGQAGGRAVAGHDHLREEQLFWVTGTVTGGVVELEIDGITSSSEVMGDAGMAWHYDGAVMRWADWTVRFAITGDAVDVTASAVVTAGRDDGCALRVESDLPDDASVTVFVSSRCATSRLINYMQKPAVDRFIEAGYQPFYDAMGDYFGSTVTYFFFDQPHANFYGWAQHHGDLASTMPYSDDLTELIRSLWPDDYPAVLLALLGGTNAAASALRAQFYEFYGARQAEIFFGTASAWTRAKGVLFTGHEVLAHVGRWQLGGAFTNWDLRINFGLDYFAIDGYRDFTSVDAQDANPQLSAKMGDSVARSHGRSGTVVEQYFGTTHTAPGVYAGHWNLTLEELRAQTFRHHLLGMRQLLFHGFYQTDGFEGDLREYTNPRFDFPPGENFEPWFADHHADFAIESARLSEFLDPLDPVCEVAVLYPLRTVWADTQGGPHAAEGGAWYETLATAGYGFHLIDESMLLAATVRNGRLVIDDRSYTTLVLPGARVVASNETVWKLAVVAEGGVQVLTSGASPSVYVRGAQTAVDDWAEVCRSSNVTVLSAPPTSGQLAALIGPAGSGTVTVETLNGAPLWWRAGCLDDQWRLAVFNDQNTPARARVTVSGAASVDSWLLDGSGVVAIDLDNGIVEIDLDPMELVLLVANPDAANPPPAVHAWSNPKPVEDPWQLVIPPGQHKYSGTITLVDPERGWEEQGLPDFAGIGLYDKDLLLDPALEYELELPSVSGSVTLWVGDELIRKRGWSPYRFPLPVAADGTVAIRLAVASAAGNRYYAGTPWRSGPEPAGILARPVIRSRPRAEG